MGAVQVIRAKVVVAVECRDVGVPVDRGESILSRESTQVRRRESGCEELGRQEEPCGAAVAVLERMNFDQARVHVGAHPYHAFEAVYGVREIGQIIEVFVGLCVGGAHRGVDVGRREAVIGAEGDFAGAPSPRAHAQSSPYCGVPFQQVADGQCGRRGREDRLVQPQKRLSGRVDPLRRFGVGVRLFVSHARQGETR